MKIAQSLATAWGWLKAKPKRLKIIVASLAGVVVVVLSSVILIQSQGGLKAWWNSQFDAPPNITFVWTPETPTSLREFTGFLTMDDDQGLDFSTYRFTVEEINKTVDFGVTGVMGTRYETKIYLALIADNPVFKTTRQATVVVSIADLKGQTTTIRRVVKLAPL